MGDEQRSPEDSTRRGESTTTGEPSLDAHDELYAALSNVQRRRLLAYLLEENEEITLDEAARVLAGWDAVESGAISTRDDYEDVRVELHHRHLPILENAGLVRYDSADRVIEPAFEQSTSDRIRNVLGVDDDSAA